MKKSILSVVFFAASFASMAQVGVGTTTPEGALDVVSANSGLIVPRVANTAAVTNPVNGMFVYDLSSHCFKAYSGGFWSECFGQSAAAAAAVSDAVLASLSSATTIADLNQILPTLTGVLAVKEADYQRYIGNSGSFSSPATQAEVQAMIDAITATDVVGPAGNIWMDRNLGASQVATSSTDTAAYGDLYQWGRAADGHQSRTSGTTNIQADTPGHGDFIFGHTNWRENSEDNLWQGVSGTNNPCPAGYRLPTQAELSGLGITNAATAFSSPLKLSLPGYRDPNGAFIFSDGINGYYWSSSVSGGTNANYLSFNNSSNNIYSNTRSNGFSVRCLKD